jgi:hypothetical protein
MAVFKLTQVIRKPLGEVFDAVIRVHEFPKWSPANRSARKLSEGPIGEGTRFELEIKGFGKTLQELQEFERNRQVRLVPHIRMLQGGHRFIFAPEGDATRIDHELEMRPRGVFKLFIPMVRLMGRKNLEQTAAALQRYLENR